MERHPSKFLSLATQLAQCAQKRDHEGFSRLLQSHFEGLARSQANPQEINRGLLFVLTAFTTMALEGRPEQIARAQSSVLEAFLHECDIPRKLERFQSALASLASEQFPSDQDSTLFQRLKVDIAQCSLSEFRSLSVASLASRYGYHPDHFTRKIKQESNRLPSEILQEERLHRAHKLLHSNHARWTFQEIALQLGFQDHRYLKRLLKARKEAHLHREPALGLAETGDP